VPTLLCGVNTAVWGSSSPHLGLLNERDVWALQASSRCQRARTRRCASTASRASTRGRSSGAHTPAWPCSTGRCCTRCLWSKQALIRRICTFSLSFCDLPLLAQLRSHTVPIRTAALLRRSHGCTRTQGLQGRLRILSERSSKIRHFVTGGAHPRRVLPCASPTRVYCPAQHPPRSEQH
jgi:hypothetical protein